MLLGSIARQDQRLGRAPLFSDRLLIDVQGGSGVRMPEQLLGDLHVNTPAPGGIERDRGGMSATPIVFVTPRTGRM